MQTFGEGPKHLMEWGWVPQAPWDLFSPLPPVIWRDDGTFRSSAQEEGLWPSFRFNFSALARQTPDLHFYRLLKLFNTPLASMSNRQCWRQGCKWWGDQFPDPRATPGQDIWSHLWFFQDRDQRHWVIEWSFDGSLCVRASAAPDGTPLADGQVSEKMRHIMAAVALPLPAPRPKPTPRGP